MLINTMLWAIVHSGGPYSINTQHSSNSIRPFQWISTLIRSGIVFMSPSSLARRDLLCVEQQCNPDTNHANPITLLHSPEASTLTHIPPWDVQISASLAVTRHSLLLLNHKALKALAKESFVLALLKALFSSEFPFIYFFLLGNN